MPAISTIIPVYNSEKYLERCLNSILSQRIADSEIIIIDDGSTDNSGMICDRYASLYSNIKVIHQKNLGVSAARNRGLDTAQGDFIHFADSDDFWQKGFYKTLLNQLKNNHSDWGISCLSKESEPGIFEIKKSTLPEGVLNSELCLKELLQSKEITPSLNDKIFNRKVIGMLRFNIKITHNEDFLFCYEYLKKCNKIYFNPTQFYFYCYNPSSAVRSFFSHKRMTVIDAHEYVLNDIKHQYPNLYKLARREFCKVIIYTRKAMNDSHYSDYEDIFRIRKILRSNLIFILTSSLSIGYKRLSLKFIK